MRDNIRNYYNRALASNDYNMGKGWNLLVGKLCKDIIALDDSVRVLQVKQKFGSLRFYYRAGKKSECRAEITNLVCLAEITSNETCEECGSCDDVSKDTGLYVQSLCKKCRKKLL